MVGIIHVTDKMQQPTHFLTETLTLREKKNLNEIMIGIPNLIYDFGGGGGGQSALLKSSVQFQNSSTSTFLADVQGHIWNGRSHRRVRRGNEIKGN